MAKAVKEKPPIDWTKTFDSLEFRGCFCELPTHARDDGFGKLKEKEKEKTYEDYFR